MSDTFDLGREIIAAFRAPNFSETVEHLRTRIEAAFVPVKHHAAVISDHDELLQCEIARAEAAEARVKVLEMHVDILEQALIDHNCGSPSCICVGCIEKRDPALGDEHGK